MFMDDINNHYTYLNSLKNVVHEEPLARTPMPDPDRAILINRDIEPVLERLMKERPTWRFKSDQRLYSRNPCYASSFEIFDGDEVLGRLWTETYWRDSTTRFHFDNFRLENQRQRRGVNYTTKPDMAAKRIIKAFHLKTPKERASEAYGQVREVVQGICNNSDWPFRKAKSMIDNDLIMYAVRNWEALQPHLPHATGIDLPTLAKAKEESNLLSTVFAAREGRTVRLEANGTYLVSRVLADSYDVQTFSDATLPNDVRGPLGLLKLVEDKVHVPHVGVRANANLYFVTDKREDIK